MVTRATAALLLLLASSTFGSWLASQDGSWTSRLGLRFKDDCQEDAGITGLIMWVFAWVVRRGQQRSGHCESKEMRCPAGTKMSGLQVRYARLEEGDRDLYDFRPRCGHLWQQWLGLSFPEGEVDREQVEAGVCVGGASTTGIQVMRGRNERRDLDYYNFKLRCGKVWAEQPLGLAFDGLRETRSATCPASSAIAGLRVHRGFQDWGDVDTYEFQLFCTTPVDKADKRSGGGGESGSIGRSHGGGGEGEEKGSRGSSRAPKKRSGGGETGARSKGAQAGARGPKAGTFGSRAAEIDAAAEEVRRELAAGAGRFNEKDVVAYTSGPTTNNEKDEL